MGVAAELICHLSFVVFHFSFVVLNYTKRVSKWEMRNKKRQMEMLMRLGVSFVVVVESFVFFEWW